MNQPAHRNKSSLTQEDLNSFSHLKDILVTEYLPGKNYQNVLEQVATLYFKKESSLNKVVNKMGTDVKAQKVVAGDLDTYIKRLDKFATAYRGQFIDTKGLRNVYGVKVFHTSTR